MKAILSSEIFWAVIAVAVPWLLGKLVAWLTVKYPALKKFKLNEKLDKVIYIIENFKKRYTRENGVEPKEDVIMSEVNKVANKVGVNVEDVEIRRREKKWQGSVGISVGPDGKPMANVGITF